MLRITCAKKTGNGQPAFCLILEGRLEGPWVSELSEAWHSVSSDGHQLIEVGLDGVTYASKEGAELLRSMRTQGAAFTTSSQLTNSWIEDQIADATERIDR